MSRTILGYFPIFLFSPMFCGYTGLMNSKKAPGAKGLYVEIDEGLAVRFADAVKKQGRKRRWVVERLLEKWINDPDLIADDESDSAPARRRKAKES